MNTEKYDWQIEFWSSDMSHIEGIQRSPTLTKEWLAQVKTPRQRLSLRRTVVVYIVNGEDKITECEYVYVSSGRLPSKYPSGREVPKRYQPEVKAFIKQ